MIFKKSYRNLENLIRVYFFCKRFGLQKIKYSRRKVRLALSHENELRDKPFDRSWLYTLDTSINKLSTFADLSNYSLIDIGSGDGLICIYVSCRFSFDRVIGIEKDEKLFELSSRNRISFLDVVPEHAKSISFQNIDFFSYQTADSPSVYFAFNPVSSKLMLRWIERQSNLLKDSYMIWTNDKVLTNQDFFSNLTIFRDSTNYWRILDLSRVK